MLFFMVDNSHFVITNASEETIKGLWNSFHNYRYDVNFSFYEFLKENGVSFKVTSPNFTVFGRPITDIEICLN
ncbi:MAG TPA: hypothetical protein VFG09_07845 [Thermodesulfovibrionales bacterium]|jgi:hypothetical protein|nr:hypothetical protein [Thermodesulfovibrionales bacterium]